MGRVVFTLADLPIRAAEDPRSDADEEEDGSEDDIGFEGKDKVCEEREAPDDQVQGDDCVVFGGGGARHGIGAAG